MLCWRRFFFGTCVRVCLCAVCARVDGSDGTLGPSQHLKFQNQAGKGDTVYGVQVLVLALVKVLLCVEVLAVVDGELAAAVDEHVLVSTLQ